MNLTAPFRLIQAVLPAMKAQHTGGSSTSSTAGRMVSTLGGAPRHVEDGVAGPDARRREEARQDGITVAVCRTIDTHSLGRAPLPTNSTGSERAIRSPAWHGTRSRRLDLLRGVRERRVHHGAALDINGGDLMM